MLYLILYVIAIFLLFTGCTFVMFGDKAFIKANRQGVLGVYCLKMCTFGAVFTFISQILGIF